MRLRLLIVSLILILLFLLPAFPQTPGTMALRGPSTGGVIVTPSAVNAGVNAQLAGKRDYQPETPDDFRQAGDADDTASLARYTAFVRAQHRPQWKLAPGRTYHVSAPIDLTGFAGEYFDLNGSTIAGTGGLYAVLDMLGTADSHLSRGTITCGTQASPCARGIQLGRYTMTQGYPQDTFDAITIDGAYTQAALFNNGSELFSATSLQAFNRYVAPGCSKAAPDACGYAVIEDGVNHWPLSSRYVPVNLTADVFESFNENVFDKPSLTNFGNGPALWLSGSHRHQYRRGYIQVQGAGAIPAAVLYSTPAAGEGDYQHLLDWDVHCEIQPSSVFLVAGNAAPAFFGLRINDHLVQGNKLFETASGVSSVRIYGADFAMTGFLNTTALFDAPGKFQVDGEVFLFQENAGLWNGPAFSGTIHTNARSNFEAGMTRGPGGFFISDPYGVDQVNVPITGPLVAASGRVVAGSDTGSTNLALDDGTHAASTPYIDLNGNGHAASVRLLNDADGNLTISSDGAWNMQLRKSLPSVFAYGISTQAALAGASINSTQGYAFASLPAASGFPSSAMVFCTNCLKPGEAANAGTGMWLFADGRGQWFSTAGTLAAH